MKNMEALTPMALAALGTAAASGVTMATGGVRSGATARLAPGRDLPDPRFSMHNLDASNRAVVGAIPGVKAGEGFDPIAARFAANSVPGRTDNLPLLETHTKDPKYQLRPECSSVFLYDKKNRGNTLLENQWYHQVLTRDSETPLSRGYLPEYQRSTGVMLRDPDSPSMLKPQKRELLQEEVWVAQPEHDRRFYTPVTGELARRARLESKMAGANGNLNGFYMNDRPSDGSDPNAPATGGPTRGFAKGLEFTREFRGYHPKQRYYRKDDNRRQRNPHGLRALNKDTTKYDRRSDLGGFQTLGKKDQTATYFAIPVADGGRMQPHLPHELRKVELRYTARDGAPPPVTQMVTQLDGDEGLTGVRAGFL